MFWGMTKYRKGPQRTTKDRKGPQRSIIQDHRGSAIMRKLPDLQKFRVFFLSNYCISIFVFFVLFLRIFEF